MLVKEIFSQDGSVIAHVYDTTVVDKTTFPTPAEFPLQFSVGVNAEGRVFMPHVHLPIERAIVGTSEFIYVFAGRMDVKFLDCDGKILDNISLEPGMGMIQIRGGHALSTIEGTRFFEIKQGPYSGVTADKIPVEPY